jgi:5-carboxymethyl-2-hydroxymuconate isomerase
MLRNVIDHKINVEIYRASAGIRARAVYIDHYFMCAKAWPGPYIEAFITCAVFNSTNVMFCRRCKGAYTHHQYK